MTTELDPIDPRTAMELHLEDIDGELSPNSVQARKYQLRPFIEWCEGADNGDAARVTNLNELTGRDLLQFKHWRAEGISAVTLRTNFSHLRPFLRFCADIDAVEEGLADKLSNPSLDPEDNVRETMLSQKAAASILDHLDRYAFASLNHVLFLLAWQIGARISALHSLDTDDVDTDGERLFIQHRPDSGTRLKNGVRGERIATLPASTIEILDEYMSVSRRDITDDHGREPLFSSPYGRLSKSAIARRFYYITSPCQFGQECPSGRDPSDCDYAQTYQSSIECPHNARPHDIRRGSITHWLREEVPKKVVSDRADVSEDTLSRHYDGRSEAEKAEQRRDYLDEVL